MTTFQFGHLEAVDLRVIWQREAEDFTPWLAANLHLLGDVIGIELELEAQEKSVGNFRADILAKDVGANEWVLIENQLERTDHSHLGQIVTYASGLKATTIGIAYQFTDEHIAALDWLNSITDDSVKFFGIQVEVWRIDMTIAPRFNIVSRPNSWVKKGKNYQRDVTEFKRSFDRKQFVFDCLREDPDISIGNIQRKAIAIGQSISVGYISEQRKSFRSLILTAPVEAREEIVGERT